MRAYIIRRLLLAIPTVFLASLIIFFTVRLIPGDIIDIMAREMQWFTPMSRVEIEHALGFDVPMLTQYGRWMGFVPQADGSFSGILEGDLGNSLWKKTPVTDAVLERMPVTLELSFLALLIAQLIALPIGIYSALRQDTWGDYIARSFATFCIAVPGFWLGTMVVVFPSIWWGWSPPIIYIPLTKDLMGNLGMLIIPSLVLGMAISGVTMRLTRTMMLEVLRQDYVRTAWAKGLRERVVVMRHALKNALIPVITLIGLYIPTLIGGTVIIEQIFCLPGVGRLLFEAVSQRDYTIVTGVMFITGIIVVLVNLAVDLTYGFLDPRIRYK